MRWAVLGLLLSSAMMLAQETPSKRPVIRPELSPEAYSKQIAELRLAYAKSPSDWPKPTLDADIKHVELGLLPEVKHPKENPYSKEKVELGKALFFDARLSGSGQMACASCHDPDLAWTDGRTTSFGHARKPLRRNAPTLLNVAFASSFFWDGRATSLEEQAKAVLANPDEMRGDEQQIVDRLSHVKGYPELFQSIFGDSKITLDRIAQAIACFERTLVGGRSKFDQFLKGKSEALSDSELRGLHLFRTDARCMHCHNGPTFSDGLWHEVGLSYYGRSLEDLGRFHVTKQSQDIGKFKTPSLRNVGRTAPYMHNGLFELSGVLNMYNVGMPTIPRGEKYKDDPKFPTKSPLLKPIQLNKQDMADLEAFLRSLNEPIRRVRPPALSLPEGVSILSQEKIDK